MAVKMRPLWMRDGWEAGDRDAIPSKKSQATFGEVS